MRIEIGGLIPIHASMQGQPRPFRSETVPEKSREKVRTGVRKRRGLPCSSYQSDIERLQGLDPTHIEVVPVEVDVPPLRLAPYPFEAPSLQQQLCRHTIHAQAVGNLLLDVLGGCGIRGALAGDAHLTKLCQLSSSISRQSSS